jgi:hypothetical protein
VGAVDIVTVGDADLGQHRSDGAAGADDEQPGQ